MSKLTRAELLAAAQVIKNETAEGANTALRVGTMLEDIIDSFSSELVVVTTPTENTAVNWSTHVVITTGASAANIVVADSTGQKLQRTIELENYSGNDLVIALNANDSFREAVPSGGFILENGEKCHLEITGVNTVSIVGV